MSLMSGILLYHRAVAGVTLGVMIVWPEVSRIICVDVETIGAERAAFLMATDVRRTGLSDDPMRRLTRWAGAGSNRRPSAFQDASFRRSWAPSVTNVRSTCDSATGDRARKLGC